MSDKTAIIKEAQKYLARGQIDKAIAEWEKILKESPDANTYNIIGDLHLKKGSKTPAVDSFHKAARLFRDEGFSLKALALYKKILNIDPSNTASLYALGELSEEKGLPTDATKYYLASADILSKEGKKDELLRTYEKILNLSPSNIPLRTKVAELFIKEGLRVEAAKEYVHIAKLCEEKNDLNNAAVYFKKAFDLHPNNKDALLGLSSIYEKTGDPRQSLEHIKKALALFPDDTELLLKCAQLLIKQESFADALPYVSKVIEIEPSNTAARKLRGELYLKEGDNQKAWEEYGMAIEEMVFTEKIDEAINTLALFKDVEPVEARKKLVSLYRQKGDFEALFDNLVFLGDTFVISDGGTLKEALDCYREALQIHPEDTALNEKIADIERELGEKETVEKPEKLAEESLAESDIFLRYGLYDEARTLLENLKVKEPENIDVHLKLKALYMETGDKEQAITECLSLANLYDKAGNTEQKEGSLKAAYEINPEDPRLQGKAATAQAPVEPAPSAPSGEEPVALFNIEDYGEHITEAAVYVRQGLYDEAEAIYQNLLKLFPDNDEIKQKLSSVETERAKAAATEELAGIAEEPPEKLKEPAEKLEEPMEKIETETEKFVISDILEAQKAAEPTLESDVLDIFEEFKKGLEKEIDTQDSETHYNLGIAFKEMGLIDDAIREFQLSKNDPKKFIQSTNMLGICYMAKGLYPLAIDSFKSALEKIEARDDSYWGVKYELAEAYEKSEDISEALAIYTEVYGWNSKFRNVAEKINLLKVMIAKPAEKPVKSEKQKPKRERVSYL